LTDPFDDLMKYWENLTQEHADWLKVKDKQSTENLFKTALKLLNQTNDFEKQVENLKPAYASGESTLIAAKFKNRYEIQRFLVSVLLELSYRLLSEIKKTKPVKEKLDPKIKAMIVEQVQIQVEKELKKVKHDTKRKKKSL
jgi:hypothetical protein